MKSKRTAKQTAPKAADSGRTRRAEGVMDAGQVESEAVSEMEFPYLSSIESAFGVPVDVSAYLDPDGCDDRGVEAFTRGSEVFFSSEQPSLEVAAHEAVHVVQHAGLATDCGMGAEMHAQTIAKIVTGGGDPRALMQSGPGADGRTVPDTERPYTDVVAASQAAGQWLNPAGRDLMVSDDGQLAVDNAGFGDSQMAWAPASMIPASNAILEAQGSRARLKAGSGKMSGDAPDGSGKQTLTEVVFEDERDSSKSNPELTDDCGTASHEVMGAANRIAAAEIGDGAGGTTHTDPQRYVGGGGAARQTAAESYFGQVMEREWPAKTKTERYALWGALSDSDRDALEQKYQIGKYAVPEVGQGITVASLYQTPGWKEQSGASMTWNFHYATSVFSSGQDYITLENYAGHGPDNWYYWMSGPASKGQSFWDQHEAQQGTFSTAFVVDKATTISVDVTNDAQTDWMGSPDFEVSATTSGGTGTSSEQTIGIGDTSTFTIALADFLQERESEPITIVVTENDPLSSSDELTMTWTPPFDKDMRSSNGLLTVTARMDV